MKIITTEIDTDVEFIILKKEYEELLKYKTKYFEIRERAKYFVKKIEELYKSEE